MILLSPAKKIQSAKPSVPLALSKARFDDKRAYLVELLKARSQAELKALFGVSDAIAALNYERYRDFSASFDKDKDCFFVGIFPVNRNHNMDSAIGSLFLNEGKFFLNSSIVLL